MDAYRNYVEFAELASIGISPNNTARIHDGRGMRLHVETGSVWITEHGSEDDICLNAGESYCIKHNGLALISTLKRRFALVTIEPSVPVAPTTRERFWAFWAGLYAPESRPTTAAL